MLMGWVGVDGKGETGSFCCGSGPCKINIMMLVGELKTSREKVVVLKIR